MKLVQVLLGCLLYSALAYADLEQVNVIVFIADDISWNDYSCYGNRTIQTPNIDQLAKHGLQFENAFLTASSCSPSRASIITGRYPHNNGEAQYLHSPIPNHLPWIPEILAKGGYKTVLSGKNHMTREDGSNPFQIKDNSPGPIVGGHGLWEHHVRARDQSKPFFYWFASNDAHRDWDTEKKGWDEKVLGPLTKPEDVIVPPYLIDDQATRVDLSHYFNEVRRFDFFVGKTVQALKEEGLFEQTLIFVLADNGRPFPRGKTRLHDSGMKTGLIAHWPKGIVEPGRKIESLVSVIDLAPTIFDATGQSTGPSFQGVSLMPIFKNTQSKVRDMVFSEHNWHDYEALARAVRFEDFLYIENYRPEFPWQGPADSVRSAAQASILAATAAGRVTKAQADVMAAPRAGTELFMNSKDPLQLENLSGNPEYSNIEAQLKQWLMQWAQQTGDTYPEKVKPDGFDRTTGDGVPDFKKLKPDWSFAGESTAASKIDHKGPVTKP